MKREVLVSKVGDGKNTRRIMWARWKVETTLGKKCKLGLRTIWLVWILYRWSTLKAANSPSLLADVITTKNMTLKDKSHKLQEPSGSNGNNMIWERTTEKDHCSHSRTQIKPPPSKKILGQWVRKQHPALDLGMVGRYSG